MYVQRISAFSDQGVGGNPAGVVLLDKFPVESIMQRVAAEVGYSETAFAAATTDSRRFRVRYFSPEIEVEFCGHATIATAVALAEVHGPGIFEFETKAGSVVVETAVEADGAVATLTSVSPEVRPVPAGLLELLLPSLNWSSADIDEELSPALSYAGAWHLVMGVRELGTLEDLKYDFEAVRGLMYDHGLTTLQLVHRISPAEFRSRNPFPVGGVVEDPATGAAAAALGAYLRHFELLPASSEISIRQGIEMGAPSHLRVTIPSGATGILVTGSARHLD